MEPFIISPEVLREMVLARYPEVGEGFQIRPMQLHVHPRGQHG